MCGYDASRINIGNVLSMTSLEKPIFILPVNRILYVFMSCLFNATRAGYFISRKRPERPKYDHYQLQVSGMHTNSVCNACMLCLAVCRSVAAVCGRVYLRRGAAPDSDRRLPVVLCTVACTVLPSPGESRLQDLVPGVRSRERRESFFSSVLSVHLRQPN